MPTSKVSSLLSFKTVKGGAERRPLKIESLGKTSRVFLLGFNAGEVRAVKQDEEEKKLVIDGHLFS